MIAVAVACTTTATAWMRSVTTCVSTSETTMPMIAAGSGSPVGAMIVVSPDVRNENGMLMTCAIPPNTSEMTTMMPSAGQKRPRMRVHERPIASRIVACSRMIAAGTSRSFVVIQSVTGIAARMTRIVRPTATGRAANPIATIAPATTAMTRSAISVSRNA